jgi:hypothetical protein
MKTVSIMDVSKSIEKCNVAWEYHLNAIITYNEYLDVIDSIREEVGLGPLDRTKQNYLKPLEVAK